MFDIVTLTSDIKQCWKTFEIFLPLRFFLMSYGSMTSRSSLVTWGQRDSGKQFSAEFNLLPLRLRHSQSFRRLCKYFRDKDGKNWILTLTLTKSICLARYTWFIPPVIVTELFFREGILGSLASGNITWTPVWCMMVFKFVLFRPKTTEWWIGEISMLMWTGIWFCKKWRRSMIFKFTIIILENFEKVQDRLRKSETVLAQSWNELIQKILLLVTHSLLRYLRLAEMQRGCKFYFLFPQIYLVLLEEKFSWFLKGVVNPVFKKFCNFARLEQNKLTHELMISHHKEASCFDTQGQCE